MSEDSLGQEKSSAGLVHTLTGDHRGWVILVVLVGILIHFWKLENSALWKGVIDFFSKTNSADDVKIVTSINFLRSDTSELLILETHINSVVNIRPFWSHVDLSAVVSISSHEVGCLSVVIKLEFLLNRAIVKSSPALSKLSNGLWSWDHLACSDFFQVLCQHF